MINEDSDIDLNLAPPPRKDKFIKPYPTVNVAMTYQNFGSAWLCVLRGKTEDIELVFNGLFNFGATNGDIQYFDHSKTVATFWSTEESLQRFFYNVSVFSGVTRYRGKAVNQAEANKKIEYIRDHCHEPFMDFDNVFAPDVYGVGSIKAENPDNDFKDKVLGHAFKDNTNFKTNEKLLTSEV